MANYAKSLVNRKQTPQTKKIPGTNQRPNNNGGYSYVVDDWKRLQRFLILGSDGGSYTLSEKTLTIQNAQCVSRCLTADYKRAIDTIVSISDAGRAPRNSPAIFALAMAISHTGDDDSASCRRYAKSKINDVCRIGTHLFEFLEYVNHMRGWGRMLREGIANWYEEKESDKLAYQIIKYPQRTITEGKPSSSWSHRDALRLARPSGDANHKAIYNYIHSGEFKSRSQSLAIIKGVEAIKASKDLKEICDLIKKFNLPHEVVPKDFANKPEVWETLLPNLPATAMIRSLGKMSSYGLLGIMSASANIVIQKLGDREWLKRSRLHPLNILIALRTYQSGHGMKGNLTWTPNPKIVNALEEAFYASFDFVEPTGKNILIGIDVSGSMTSPIANYPITSCEAAACLAMVAVRTEPNAYIVGFAKTVKDLGITEKDTLASAARKCQENNFGSTNCAAAMEYAVRNKLPVDTFLIITDNDTNNGRQHPSQALRSFRSTMNRPAKMAVLATYASNFSIADPNDAGMLDLCGFDTSVPQVLADFMRD